MCIRDRAINVQGKEGDVYSLSGWASTTGAKPGGEFRIAAAFIFDGAEPKWFHATFNESVTGWQFANGIGVADDGDPTTTRTYSAIHVYVFYKDQLNPVYIDNLQLVKDNGQSYVYDDDGNVTSSADAAEDSKFCLLYTSIKAFECLTGHISGLCTLSGKLTCFGSLSGKLSAVIDFNAYSGEDVYKRQEHEGTGIVQNGGTTPTSGNNYNFTQNNYSPKALSRIDIYRQTKNQFSALKGLVET